jgi:hypothetical protein
MSVIQTQCKGSPRRKSNVVFLQNTNTIKITTIDENGKHLAKLILQTARRPRSALTMNRCSGALGDFPGTCNHMELFIRPAQTYNCRLSIWQWFVVQ